MLYRKVGRKVFLATNSLWDYTNVVMNFLVDGATGSATSLDWLQVRPPACRPSLLEACVWLGHPACAPVECACGH